jgi:large conductance mechanosensitive channel
MTDDEMLNELKNIRKLLEPKPTPPAPPAPKGLMNEFKAFLSQYKILGMAVAFILGIYLGALVASLVSDLVMPLIGLVLPGLGNLNTLSVTVINQVFGVGHFIAAVITFIIVALVIFLIVKMTKRMGIE